jgi:hypothetical protein
VGTFADGLVLPPELDEAGQQREALRRAADLITGATGGQRIAAGTSTVTLTGNGRRLIQVPQVPVRAVTALSVDGRPWTAVDYAVDPDGVLTRLGGVWPRGQRIIVTYDHGYLQLPEDIARLVTSLAQRILDGTVGVRSETESLGSRQTSITYHAGAGVFDDADQDILDRYRPPLLP